MVCVSGQENLPLWQLVMQIITNFMCTPDVEVFPRSLQAFLITSPLSCTYIIYVVKEHGMK